MKLFDSIRKLYRDFGEGVDAERTKLQVEAFKKAKLTDEYVTITVVGDVELDKMTRAGWDFVARTNADTGAHSLFSEYLMRRRRDDLARSLGFDPR